MAEISIIEESGYPITREFDEPFDSRWLWLDVAGAGLRKRRYGHHSVFLRDSVEHPLQNDNGSWTVPGATYIDANGLAFFTDKESFGIEQGDSPFWNVAADMENAVKREGRHNYAETIERFLKGIISPEVELVQVIEGWDSGGYPETVYGVTSTDVAALQPFAASSTRNAQYQPIAPREV